MISSRSKFGKPLALVPFFYSIVSRAEGVRDIAYLVGSSWLPAIWIVYRLADVEIGAAIFLFLMGYFAFVSIYELGYFVNDAWDAKRSPGGRQRVDFSWGRGFVILFVAARIGSWLAIGYWLDWLWSPVWLACFAALVAVFAQHNVIESATLRSASFLQLATLRFVTPVIALIPRTNITDVFVAAFLFYTYFRLLSYLDSKSLLTMPERKKATFSIIQVLMFFPIAAFVSYASESQLIIELYVYFAAVFFLWAGLSRIRFARFWN